MRWIVDCGDDCGIDVLRSVTSLMIELNESVLATVEPERTCHDVHKEGFFECSDCCCIVQLMSDFEPTIFAGRAILPNYCPNCGARVVGD